MLFATALFLFAAVSASARSLDGRAATVTHPLKRRGNPTSIRDVVEKGRARVSSIDSQNTGSILARANAANGPGVASVTDFHENIVYGVMLTIGSQTYNLIVDTGSSTTWVGAGLQYKPSPVGRFTGNISGVLYGSGGYIGVEAIDTVSLGNGITVSSQSIGAASFSLGLGGFDGILGLGPVDLTKGTVVSVDSIITQTWSNRTVPTFTNNLVSEGVISQDIVGAYFQPLHGSNASEADGEITFGGFDSSKFTGDLTYFPRLTSGNLSAYWSIAVEEVKYGTVAIGTGLTAMVDTGTDVILLPTSVFSAFMKTSGGFNDRINNIAVFSTKPTSNFEITLGQTTYTLTPDQYLLPMAQYSNFGLDTDKYYAWFADSGSSTFILGQKFLEYYYSVYDTSNSRVGLAKAV